jgi:hypothetical protein
MNSFEPIVREYNSAAGTARSFTVIIMRSIVRSVGSIITVTNVAAEWLDFHSADRLQNWLSDKSWHFFNHIIFVFDVEIDSVLNEMYIKLSTLSSLVGVGSSWWVEKKLTCLICGDTNCFIALRSIDSYII